jgi:hypothetical protein
MAHEGQVRYSDLVKAKLRKDMVLKDGIVFNNDYEGDPKAGSVKIPVRDTEVAVSDYDKANGITAGTGGTSYEVMNIDKDKAVNEIIDGYDAASVPDGIVAERLDSAGYSLALQIDTDGATTLVAGATVVGVEELTSANIYDKIVDQRTAMSKANIPNDGRRYLLVTPDALALILKDTTHFVNASALGDAVVQSGAVGKIANFMVYEWNDTTANLAMVAGHPRFATRANEWSVPVELVSLKGSGKYIGASAVEGRFVYAHKVLRQVAIRAIYSPASLALTVAVGTTNVGETKVTATAGSGNSLAYKKNPTSRCAYGTTSTAYAGTSMTSGTAKVIGSCVAGDIIEVVEFNSDGNAIKVGYVTLVAADIKAS